MRNIKILLFFIFLFNITLVFAQSIQIPELNSPITDLTETLTESELELIKNKLLNFEKDSTGQFVVLIIPTTGNETIEEYSIRLAEQWEIGSEKNDDGIILLVAKNDRTLRIEVGYGIEHAITDANAQKIIDNIIVPEFRAGDFNKGIDAGIDAIIGLTKGLSLTVSEYETSTENYYEDSEEEPWEKSIGWMIVGTLIMMASMILPFAFMKRGILFYIILLILIVGVNFLIGYLTYDISIAYIFSGMPGFMVLIVLLLKIIAFLWAIKTGKDPSSLFTGGSGTYSSSSSGWSSSSSSSSYSSGNSYSGSSGYSGGGGSFGGGGASGSW